MKAIVIAVAFAGSVVSSQAFALSPACRQAAAMGGPCGCVAAEHIFGTGSKRDLWAVSNWYKFPRSAPGPGTVALWGHRHVEAVVSANGDGTVTTTGPYGVRRVKAAGLNFVRPSGGHEVSESTFAMLRVPGPNRRETHRVTGGQHVHYAHIQRYYHHRHYAMRQQYASAQPANYAFSYGNAR